MTIPNISFVLLFLFASASGRRLSLRGNIASVDKSNRQYFRLRRERDHTNDMNVHDTVTNISGDNQMKRMILDDTQTIPVMIYPFTVTISPTAQPLQQFQIDEIGETIETLVSTNFANSGDAGLSLVRSVQLSGVSRVTFTPSQRIDDWRTLMSKSVLEFKAGIAQTHYSIFNDTPTPNQLSIAVESVLKQHLMTSIRSNVNGLEWIQVVNVEMHLPYSSLSPTVSPIQPTLSPIQPTLSPIASPSGSPTFIQSLEPTTSPTATSAVPTFYPTTQKPSSLEQLSTATPTIPLGEEDKPSSLEQLSTVSPTISLSENLTMMPTFENIGSNNNNGASSTVSNDFQGGGNQIHKVLVKTPVIWGVVSCAVLIVGLVFMKKRRRKSTLSNHDSFRGTNFIPDKYSFDEDGDSTLTPETIDGYMTPKGTRDDNNENCTPKHVEMIQHEELRNECREPTVDLNCIPAKKRGPYESLPSDFCKGSGLGDESSVIRCSNVSQEKMLSLEKFPLSIEQREQSQVPEQDLPTVPNEYTPNSCSIQNLVAASSENRPTLDDFFSQSPNIFRDDDTTDRDQDDKSSVHMNPLETSSVFEQFDENEELWGDDGSGLECNAKTASNIVSVGPASCDESAGRDDNEFILDDSWDPDDTDSASESPSFGMPQFEPVYENILGSHSDESNNDR
mmetsp:Transcript_14886/g.27978  ORF Transcript_14886/g.27978 Transcript_14886/m.27978 type:complete len:676 (-) Transcript_14886:1176-3203(-)